MDSEESQKLLRGALLRMVPGRKTLDQTPTTPNVPLVAADRMTLSSEAGQPNLNGPGSTHSTQGSSALSGPPVTRPAPGKFTLQPPLDAGAFPIRAGDIVMTRSMYEFLITTLTKLPFLSDTERKSVCSELSYALKELVK